MRNDSFKNLTYYIISAPESDECVLSLKSLLNLACNAASGQSLNQALLKHPLEAHILLSKMLCESSQGYINLFRQSMFAQVCRIPLTTFSDFYIPKLIDAAPSRRRDFSPREP